MIRGKIMVSKSVLKYIHIFIAFAMMLCLFAQKAEAKPSDFGERVAESISHCHKSVGRMAIKGCAARAKRGQSVCQPRARRAV